MKNTSLSPAFKFSPAVLLSLIFLLGLGLRLYKLDFQSFWLDEYYNIHLALKPGWLFGGISNVPPVYINLLKLWLKFFSITETNVRLLGALIGSFSLLVFYLLGRELFNRQTALWTSFFLAISATHIDYSQEAKYYPLVLFMATLMQLWYIKILKYNRPNDYFWYGVFSTVTFYTHYYLVFLFFVQWVHLGICFKTYRECIPRIIKTQVISLGIFLPCVLYLIISPRIAVSSLSWLPKPVPANIVETVVAMTAGQGWQYRQTFFPDFRVPHLWYYIFGAVLCILLVQSWRRIKLLQPNVLFVVLWIILPIMFFYFFSVSIFSIFHIRYILSTMLALYLFFAWLVTNSVPDNQNDNKEKNNRWASLLSVIFFISTIIVIFYLACGHNLIEAMYNKTSWPFLNKIIEAPAEWPLVSYLQKADKIFSVFLIFFLGLTIFIPQKDRNRIPPVVFVCIFFLLNTSNLSYYFNNPVRPQFREAADFISKNCLGDEKIIVNGYHHMGTLFQYYFVRSGLHNSVKTDTEKNDLASSEYHWVVDGFLNIVPDQNLTLVKELNFVKIYHRNNDRPFRPK